MYHIRFEAYLPLDTLFSSPFGSYLAENHQELEQFYIAGTYMGFLFGLESIFTKKSMSIIYIF